MPLRFTQTPEGIREPKELSASEIEGIGAQKEGKKIGVIVVADIGHTKDALLAILEHHKDFSGDIIMVEDTKDIPGYIGPKSLEEQLKEMKPMKIELIAGREDHPEISFEKKTSQIGFNPHYVPKTQKKKVNGKKYVQRKK